MTTVDKKSVVNRYERNYLGTLSCAVVGTFSIIFALFCFITLSEEIKSTVHTAHPNIMLKIKPLALLGMIGFLVWAAICWRAVFRPSVSDYEKNRVLRYGFAIVCVSFYVIAAVDNQSPIIFGTITLGIGAESLLAYGLLFVKYRDRMTTYMSFCKPFRRLPPLPHTDLVIFASSSPTPASSKKSINHEDEHFETQDKTNKTDHL